MVVKVIKKAQAPTIKVGKVKLINGDCLIEMQSIAPDSIDAIVTDPPYGLTQNKKGGSGTKSIDLESPYGRARIGTGNGQGGFMGMKWDHGVPGKEFWIEALRIAKPGAHLLAFGGDRTHHRLMTAIEDAGWELRTCVYWCFGTGFPKSLDVSKAIDKEAGAKRKVVGSKVGMPGYSLKHQGAGGVLAGRADGSLDNSEGECEITAPVTNAAKQWMGWGSALKPAIEIIIMARKPLAKGLTVAANVLVHGTGGLNIDGCRVELNGEYKCGANGRPSQTGLGDNYDSTTANQHSPVGRWPANLIHSGEPEVLACFPDSKGQMGKASITGKHQGNGVYAALKNVTTNPEVRGDAGSAARFFYCAKASSSERHAGMDNPGEQFKLGDTLRKIENKDVGKGNHHPTVKPVALMQYLCRLITPPNGIILDPFMGSGSTGKAALKEGFRFVGIELEKDYFEIAKKRIKG